MSIEALLDALAIPSVHSKVDTRELLDTTQDTASSPSSPGSLTVALAINEPTKTVDNRRSIVSIKSLGSAISDDNGKWQIGYVSNTDQVAYVRALLQCRQMDQGIVPNHYTHRATCKGCGPVWLWFTGEVQGCPWCWNRAKGLAVPRP